MTRSSLASAMLLAFVLAVLMLQWTPRVPFHPVTWASLICITGGCILLMRRWPRATYGLACCVGITIALLAVARVTGSLPDNHIVALANKQIVTLLGTVAENPDPREKGTNVVITAERMITATGAVRSAQGRVLLRLVKKAPSLAYGDRVIARGKVQKPWPIQDFRYDLYLARQDIFAIMSGVRLERAENDTPFTLIGWLQNGRNAVDGRIASLVPEPEASFMMGLITGTRRTIPQNIIDAFNATGLTHIIAISGFNVTIVLTMLSGLLFWLPLRWRFFPSLVAVIAFTLFTGASASVVRAAIMGCLGLLALQLGRQTNTRLLILWTLFAMLCWQPRQLWVDASFQLSFLAVIGLAEIQPLLARSPLSHLPAFLGIREGACTTLAAECATLPWIMALFGRCSLIAPIANLIVTPLIPFAMLLSAVALGASFLPSIVSHGVATLAWLFLHLILLAIQILAHLPYASIATPPLNTITVAVIYSSIMILTLWLQQRASLTNDTNTTTSAVAPPSPAPRVSARGLEA